MYARSKQAYDEGQKETDMSKRPTGGLIELVQEFEFAIAKERIEEFEKENDPNR